MASKSYANYFDGKLAQQMANGSAPNVPIRSTTGVYAPPTKRFKGGPGQVARATQANGLSANPPHPRVTPQSGMDSAVGSLADRLHPTGVR